MGPAARWIDSTDGHCSKVAAYPDIAICIFAMHLEASGEVHREWPEMVVCSGSGILAWIGLGDAHALIAQSCTRSLQQLPRDALSSATWLDQETENGANLP